MNTNGDKMIDAFWHERKCGRVAAGMVDTAESNPRVEVYTVTTQGSIRRLWLRTGKKSWVRMEYDACRMQSDASSYEMIHDWRGPLSDAVTKFDAVSGLPVLALLGFRVRPDAYAEEDVKRWVFMLRLVKRADLAFKLVNTLAEQNGRPVESWDAACKRVMLEFMDIRLYIGFGLRTTSIDQMVRHAASVIGVRTGEHGAEASRCAADILRATGLPFDGYRCKYNVILPAERAARARDNSQA